MLFYLSRACVYLCVCVCVCVENPCHSEPCSNSGTCTVVDAAAGTRKCDCPLGFIGDSCEFREYFRGPIYKISYDLS